MMPTDLDAASQRGPFSESADPALFYEHPASAAIEAQLCSALIGGTPLAVLVGEPGTGKTALLGRLVTDLEAAGFACFVQSFLIGADDLRECLPPAQPDRRLAVALDEAQALDDELFRALPELLAERPDLCVILVGQPALEIRLASARVHGVHLPIDVRCHLEPLPERDVRNYMEHRWRKAGAGPMPFDTAAVARIEAISGRVPQVINLLASRALRLGEQRGQATISDALVDEVSAEFMPPVANGRLTAGVLGAQTAALIAPLLIAGGVLLMGPAPTDRPMPQFGPMPPRVERPAERSDGDEARPAPPLIDRLTDSAASSRIADRLRSGAAVAVLPPAPLIAADPQMAVPESDIRSEGGPTAAARATSRGDVLRSEYALGARERAPREAPAPGVRGDRPAPAVASRAPSEASAGSANPEPRLPAKSPAPAAVTALPPRAAPAPTRVAATPVRRPTDETLLLRAEQGDVSGVRLLLSEGATPDARDASGFTPLMLAIIHDQRAIADALMASGASVNAKNRAGLSPLMLAAINNRPLVARKLIESGADVNAATLAGWTALTYAAWRGHPGFVRLLLSAGADPTVADREGWTILQYLRWRATEPAWREDPAGTLAGAETLRSVATGPAHAEIVSLLRQAGATR